MNGTFKFLMIVFWTSLSPIFGSTLVLMSGTPSSAQKKVVEEFLKGNVPEYPTLVRWENDNQDCRPNQSVGLHLCFRNDDVEVVYENERLLQKTLYRLMELSP